MSDRYDAKTLQSSSWDLCHLISNEKGLVGKAAHLIPFRDFQNKRMCLWGHHFDHKCNTKHTKLEWCLECWIICQKWRCDIHHLFTSIFLQFCLLWEQPRPFPGCLARRNISNPWRIPPVRLLEEVDNQATSLKHILSQPIHQSCSYHNRILPSKQQVWVCRARALTSCHATMCLDSLRDHPLKLERYRED